jgi:hypothetical protein
VKLTALAPKKMPKRPSKLPLIFETNGAMSAVPSGTPVVPTTSPPFFLICSMNASFVDWPHA